MDVCIASCSGFSHLGLGFIPFSGMSFCIVVLFTIISTVLDFSNLLIIWYDAHDPVHSNIVACSLQSLMCMPFYIYMHLMSTYCSIMVDPW
jgi:hypothetical protein